MAGSTTTSRASGSATTSAARPTPGTPWRRPDSELYRGVRLTRALDWQSRTESLLTDTESDFLSAAKSASDAEERSAAEQARAQTRLIRRLRIVLSGAAVLLVLALIAGGMAAVQSDRARRNAGDAYQAAVSADARRVGTRAQLTDEISLSLLLAVAGARLDDSPETRVNLLTALAKQPQLVRSAPPGGGYLEGMDVSRDGRLIASSDDRNRMHLYDAATNRLLRSYDAGRPRDDEQAFLIGAFSPDSRHLAVILTGVESSEPVRVLDPNTMLPTAELDFPGSRPVWGVDVQFSADGRYLGATMHTRPVGEDVTTPGFALVWDLQLASQPAGAGTDRHRPPGDGAQPGRPHVVHQLATDGLRRGDGAARSGALTRRPHGSRST